MKKLVVLALVLAIFSVSVPRVEAQSFTVEQQASLDSLRETLISLLIKQIEMLQAQINEILAKQAQEPAKVEVAPVFGSANETSITFIQPQCIATGPYTERNRTPIHFTMNGEWNEVIISYERPQIMAGYNSNGYAVLRTLPKQKDEVRFNKGNGKMGFEIYNYPDTYNFSVKVDGVSLGDHSVSLNACE